MVKRTVFLDTEGRCPHNHYTTNISDVMISGHYCTQHSAGTAATLVGEDQVRRALCLLFMCSGAFKGYLATIIQLAL